MVAAHDVPVFANSAMDGFAGRAAPAGTHLRVVGESRAGAPFAGTLTDGEAIRISTGAALPAGADGVLQIEPRSTTAATPSSCRTPSTPGATSATPAATCAPGRSC